MSDKESTQTKQASAQVPEEFWSYLRQLMVKHDYSSRADMVRDGLDLLVADLEEEDMPDMDSESPLKMAATSD